MNKDAVYLTQTDTTVGFVSQSSFHLAQAKERDTAQPFILCVSSYKKQKNLTRTPKNFRKKVRRMRKVTWLYPNKKAIRVVKEHKHQTFLKDFTYVYSSSANKNKKDFNLAYAKNQADIMIIDRSGFHQQQASTILKLGKNKIHKLR